MFGSIKTKILHWLYALISAGIILTFFNFKIWDPVTYWTWNTPNSINIYTLLLMGMIFGMSWTMLSRKRSEFQLGIFSLYTFLQFYFVIDTTLGPWFKWMLIHLMGLKIAKC